MARRSLTTNVAASIANVVAVVGASLLAVPLLIDRLGLAGYGLWVLAQTLVIYVGTAEMGFGPALARFASIRAGEPDEIRRVLVAAGLAYLAIGAVIAVVFALLAEPLVGLVDVPPGMTADAVDTVQIMGLVALAALLAAALGHVLSGMERFTAFTVTNAAGSVAFLVIIFAALGADAALTDVAKAALAQWVLVTVLRIGVLWKVIAVRGRVLPERALVRELLGFSARLQPATLATLLNTQTDRVVVAMVAPATTLGSVSVGSQVAEAGRFLAYAAFSPMASRMAVTYGTDGHSGLEAALRAHRRFWVVAVCGAVAIAVGVMQPAIEAWIGPGNDDAALFAVLLTVGYGIGVLPNPAFAYLRAIGRPGLEGAFGVVTFCANLVATIVLGLAAGATGVVAATALAYLASTIWVSVRLRRTVPAAEAGDAVPVARMTAAALAAAALAYVTGEGLLDLLPAPLALLAMGVVTALLFGAYLGAATGIGRVRELLARRSASTAESVHGG